MSGRVEIADEFWPLLEAKIKLLAAGYNPVHMGRLYPFLVSHFPARMIETIIMRAIERGPPEQVRFVRLINE